MKESENRQSERTRLQEVAIKAGVSASTVSLVLAGKAAGRRISPDTQARVAKIAEDLNYAPNLLTRSLRRGRTHVLSLFSSFRHREEGDLYMDKLSTAIEVAGGAAGYDILVHCNFRRSPKEIYQFLNGGLADGLLLFAPRRDDPLLSLLRKSSLPVVLLNSHDPLGKYPSVVDDEDGGIALVANRLLEIGHRRIAVLSGDSDDARDADSRVARLVKRLAEHGVEVPDRWRLHSGDDAMPAVSELFGASDSPTAIFCWHDRLAYNVLAAADILGIPVPEQVSVIGYDGLQWPSITKHVAASVHVDLNDFASEAVRILDDSIRGVVGAAARVVLPVTFEDGTSLAPPGTRA